MRVLVRVLSVMVVLVRVHNPIFVLVFVLVLLAAVFVIVFVIVVVVRVGVFCSIGVAMRVSVGLVHAVPPGVKMGRASML